MGRFKKILFGAWVDKFVVDAGPFIHLDQIDQLGVLGRLPSLLIPSGVLLELRDARLRNVADRWKHVQIFTLAPKAVANPILKRFALDRGETECLALALNHSPCIFLTDDLAARNAAEKLAIEVHGTVGIIAYAVKRNWLTIPQAEKALNLLYERSSLFITYAIIESAIRRLRDLS